MKHGATLLKIIALFVIAGQTANAEPKLRPQPHPGDQVIAVDRDFSCSLRAVMKKGAFVPFTDGEIENINHLNESVSEIYSAFIADQNFAPIPPAIVEAVKANYPLNKVTRSRGKDLVEANKLLGIIEADEKVSYANSFQFGSTPRMIELVNLKIAQALTEKNPGATVLPFYELRKFLRRVGKGRFDISFDLTQEAGGFVSVNLDWIEIKGGAATFLARASREPIVRVTGYSTDTFARAVAGTFDFGKKRAILGQVQFLSTGIPNSIIPYLPSETWDRAGDLIESILDLRCPSKTE